MSFYRTFIAAVAAMGLATAVFAADENANPAQPADANQTQAAQAAPSATDQQAQPQPAQAGATDQQAKVDVNKASVKELTKVKGLSAAKAKAIVAYRKKHGDFKSLDDLKMVKGFKKMHDDQLKSIQDQLTTG